TERRMAGKRQLDLGREDPDAHVRILDGGREDEDGLREIHLARQARHRLLVQVASVGEDGELVAGQRRIREDVGDHIAERRHKENLPTVPCVATAHWWENPRAWASRSSGSRRT